MPRAIVLAVGLVAACGGGTSTDPVKPAPDAGGPPPPTCGDAAIKLGTGAREYQAVQDGDTVFLFSGPQGGYMVYLSVQAQGFDPSDLDFCYTETFASGAPLGTGCWRVQLTNNLGGGWYERVGIWGQIDTSFWTSPNRVRGQDIHVTATLSDRTTGCKVGSGWSVHVSPDRP
jgi:hypothetical protein